MTEPWTAANDRETERIAEPPKRNVQHAHIPNESIFHSCPYGPSCFCPSSNHPRSQRDANNAVCTNDSLKRTQLSASSFSSTVLLVLSILFGLEKYILACFRSTVGRGVATVTASPAIDAL